MLSPVVPLELEIGRKPLLIRVNDDDQELPTIVDPFDAGFREATLQELEAQIQPMVTLFMSWCGAWRTSSGQR